MLCNVVVDEMSIRSQLIIKNDKNYGLVDLGMGSSSSHTSDNSQPNDVDAERNDKTPPLAKKSLVFMLVALNSNWKVPFAYFMVDSIDSQQQGILITRAFELLEEHSIIARSLTFDGERTNFSTVKLLGANVDVMSPNFKPYFKHPIKTDENVYIFPDPSHMIKNVRNSLGKTMKRNKKGELLYTAPFKDEFDRKISFECIEKIVALQTEEGLRAGNKLRDRHVKYEENRMNVRLAVQTLSHSTFAALKYVQKKYPNKFPVTGTPDYALHFNNAFDILNNNSPFGKTQYMKPINVSTIHDLEMKAETIINYIKQLKDYNGKNLVSGTKKCGFIGFIICLKNVFSLFRDLNLKYKLRYLLTKKLLQDHLENFFCCVRMRGGFNDNPNGHQFACAYRMLVQHHQVKSLENANCVHIEDVPILSVTVNKKELADSYVKLETEFLTDLREKFNF